MASTYYPNKCDCIIKDQYWLVSLGGVGVNWLGVYSGVLDLNNDFAVIATGDEDCCNKSRHFDIFYFKLSCIVLSTNVRNDDQIHYIIGHLVHREITNKSHVHPTCNLIYSENLDILER